MRSMTKKEKGGEKIATTPRHKTERKGKARPAGPSAHTHKHSC